MLLHILDPLDGLSLGVHHQRPSTALGDDDAILSGESIRGETFDVPVPHFGGVGQERGKGEVGGTRNSQFSHLQQKCVENHDCMNIGI